MERAIIHLDLDAFYASAEQLRRPELRGRPVIVGGGRDDAGAAVLHRGVVSAASYEARAFGVHSAMPLRSALRLCPTATVLPVDFAEYRRLSREVFAEVERFSPQIEPVSLDEAYVDVTDSQRRFGPAAAIAVTLRDRIRASTGLTASFGVATNKTVAKIASDLEKPAGMVVVVAGTEAARLAPLPLRRLPGLGPAAERELSALGITTLGALAALPREVVVRRLGASAGGGLWERAQGIDSAPVVPPGAPRSISREETLDRDTIDVAQVERRLRQMAHGVASSLRAQQLAARTVTLRLRLGTWETLERQRTLASPTDSGAIIGDAVAELLHQHWPGMPIRLLGVGVANMTEERQLDLFDQRSHERDQRLNSVLDDLAQRFGATSITRGMGGADRDLDFRGEDLRMLSRPAEDPAPGGAPNERD